MAKFIQAIFVGSVIFFSSISGFAQEPAAGQSSGKVYVVFLNDAKVNDYVVTNLEAVDFQGVKSLKGTAVDLPGWVKTSKAIYFPADKVVTVVEFNSLTDYVNSLK
jgi:hypothetical protein